MVNVKNRSSGSVIYSLRDKNLRREFAPGEVKKIDEEELIALTYLPGGKKLIEDYLLVESPEEVEQLNIKAEPEYWMDANQVQEMLKNGTMDQFLDCLDFAPPGVLDMIKQYAISMPLNDVQKREAIKEKLGFDVGTAIKNSQEEREAAASQKKERRTAPPTTTTGRRSTPPKYNVVAPAKED